MASTFSEFRTLVSRDLRDPDGKTFEADTVGDMVNAAIAELGSIAPDRFQEDITPVADTLTYQVRAAAFPDGVPEVELVRVELWDGSTTPPTQVGRLRPADGEYVNDSQTGWKVWGGQLELTTWQEAMIDPVIHLIRVWGYSPYPPLVADADVIPLSNELQNAARDYCRIQGLRRLIFERDLFTQWQTRTNNSDVSPASLMNGLAQAEESWRRTRRQLMVLRETP